jgi:hypothetical protein
VGTSSSRLPADLCDSQAFFDAFAPFVLKVRDRHRELAGIYASWDEKFLPFNPFRIAARVAPC